MKAYGDTHARHLHLLAASIATSSCCPHLGVVCCQPRYWMSLCPHEIVRLINALFMWNVIVKAPLSAAANIARRIWHWSSEESTPWWIYSLISTTPPRELGVPFLTRASNINNTHRLLNHLIMPRVYHVATLATCCQTWSWRKIVLASLWSLEQVIWKCCSTWILFWAITYVEHVREKFLARHWYPCIGNQCNYAMWCCWDLEKVSASS